MWTKIFPSSIVSVESTPKLMEELQRQVCYCAKFVIAKLKKCYISITSLCDVNFKEVLHLYQQFIYGPWLSFCHAGILVSICLTMVMKMAIKIIDYNFEHSWKMFDEKYGVTWHAFALRFLFVPNTLESKTSMCTRNMKGDFLNAH